MVSEAWREMPPDEKETWEKKARKDKARYEVEKAMYKGPWKVPANKRTPKDPTAPKRPMSAFLAFSNKRRAGLKREHPDATNSDLSKMLSKTWKEAPDELRKKYMEEEAALRATYKVEMAKWRKKAADEKKLEREEREAIAMQAAEARQNDVANGVPPGASSATAAAISQYNAVTGQTNTAGQQGQDMTGGMSAAQMYGNPYMTGAMGGFGGMAADPNQYATMMGAGGFGAGQAGIMGAANAQHQLFSQFFTQQFKQPMGQMGNLGMYQGFPGQGMAGQQQQQGAQGQQQDMQQQQQGGQEQQQQGQQQAGMMQGFGGNYGMDMQRAAMMAAQAGQMNQMGGGQNMAGGGQNMAGGGQNMMGGGQNMMGGGQNMMGGGQMGGGGEQQQQGTGGGDNSGTTPQQQEQGDQQQEQEQQQGNGESA